VARLAVRLDDASSGVDPDRHGRAPFDWDAAQTHCRLAWLRGRFLSCGSLSLAEGRVHLEFVVSPEDAPGLAARLAALGLPASWRVRRRLGVVTWKSGERVVTFLRLVGGTSGALELDSRLVTRQLHGHLNRVLNAETANLGRAVAASTRQLEAISVLESTGALATLPERDRAVARVRRAAPEATLGELAQQRGSSRSLVQRSLQRLERAAGRAAAGGAPR
jgi:DNA-binding protein WhiA